MRKAVIVASILVAVLAQCAPALAWPVSLPWWQPTTHFRCVGKILAVGSTARSVTARVRLASGGAADYLGEDLTVSVASDARISKAVGRRLVGIALATSSSARSCASRAPSTTPPAQQRTRASGSSCGVCRSTRSHASPSGDRSPRSTLTARLSRVTTALSPSYHREQAFAVAADARIWVTKDRWPARATLADVVVGDRVYAQGVVGRSLPSAPVFTIRSMMVRPAAVTPTL